MSEREHIDPATAAREQTIPWQDLIASVFRHRRVVLTLLLTGIALATVRGWTVPPTYKSSSLLMIRDNRTRMTVSPDESSDAVLERSLGEQVNALVALLGSTALVQEVLDDDLNEAGTDTNSLGNGDAGLWAAIGGLPGRLYRQLHHVNEPSPLERMARNVAKGVIVTPRPKSNIVQVDFYAANPTWAANFLDRLVDRAITKYTSVYDATHAQPFYRSQRDLLASRVDEAQAALTAFRERVGPELLTFNRDQLRDDIALLEQERAATKATVAELKVRMNASPETILSDANSAGGSDSVANPAISAIKARLLELEIKRSELISRYAPGSVMISDLNRQIAAANRLLNQERANSALLYKQEAQSRIETANARLDAVGQQLAEYRETLAKLESIVPEWERLQSDLDTQRQAYATYFRKEEQARVSNALDESQLLDITVTQPANPPRDPEASPLIMPVVAGGGIGLLLGIGIALLRDWIDPSIKSTSQAERLTGVPVLAEIPL